MIKVNDLTKYYGRFRALKGIDLCVEKNDIYGFLGPNGAGKSTTINILAGLSRIDGGSCIVNGRKLEKGLAAGKLEIGYLPEEPRFYPWMTPLEYFRYIGSDYAGNVKCRIDEILEMIDLKKASRRKIGGFSRGMRQRMGLGTAMFYDPPLLLLDEPSSALDPKGRSEVLGMIKDLRERGKTIFLSTHIIDDVEKVCNKVGILSEGSMLAQMELDELLGRYVRHEYEISCLQEPSLQDIEYIRRQDWTADIETYNSTILVRIDHALYKGNMIFALAEKLTVPVRSISRRHESLEDIFISIIQENRDETDDQKRIS